MSAINNLESQIPSGGEAGQVWTSSGSGAGKWADTSGAKVPTEVYRDIPLTKININLSQDIAYSFYCGNSYCESGTSTFYPMKHESTDVVGSYKGLYYDSENSVIKVIQEDSVLASTVAYGGSYVYSANRKDATSSSVPESYKTSRYPELVTLIKNALTGLIYRGPANTFMYFGLNTRTGIRLIPITDSDSRITDFKAYSFQWHQSSNYSTDGTYKAGTLSLIPATMTTGPNWYVAESSVPSTCNKIMDL